jgi:D-lactate dehydrogenase
MFGPAAEGVGASRAFLRLCELAGVRLRTPDGIGAMCCGTPWKSKGLSDGYRSMQDRVVHAMWEASEEGTLPIVSDAASCTEGLGHMLEHAASEGRRFRVIDSLAFVDQELLHRLPSPRKIPSLVLHPTCSTTHLGLNQALERIAGFTADAVTIPDDWGCCAFAGDRGLLHPELTQSATAREAAEVGLHRFDAYASANRTCELGMSRATGHPYRHVLEVLEEAIRAGAGAQ